MSQTRRTDGSSVFRTSRRLAISSVCRLDTPVTLAPGWASLPTMPAPTGSPTRVNTMGTLSVASLAGLVAASWLVKIRSTPALTSASAAAGIVFSFPSVKRMSNVTSRPSSKPSPLSPPLSPSTVGWLAAHAALRTPIRNGRRACCASMETADPPTIITATNQKSDPASRSQHLRSRRDLTDSAALIGASPRHALIVGAPCDAVPGAHQRLELRERRVHLPGHGALLGFVPDDFGRQLLQVAQHGHRVLENFDLALEFRLEALERDRVLHVIVREAIDLGCRGGVVEHPPQT